MNTMLRILPTQGNVFSRSASTLTFIIASRRCSADSICVSRKSRVANSCTTASRLCSGSSGNRVPSL